MLKAKKNLTGQIFGRWKVICQAEDHISTSGRHEIAWLCECMCENHTRKIVLHRSLIYELSKSCGCLQKEKVHNIFFNDLTGQKFGRLTVVERVDDLITENGNRFTRWKCNCDCGNECVVLAISLTRTERPTRSCGCLQIEASSKIIENKYDFSNEDYVIGYTSNTNMPFLFDKEDFDMVKEYHWYEEDDGYIRASNKDRPFLHRLVMGFPDDIKTDHIKHNKYDNRKNQLRAATTSQNAMNVGVRSNNSSGHTGVVWVEKMKKWRAEIKVNNETIYLGYSGNKNEAIEMREKAEEEHFGEYSYSNSMKRSV